MVDDVITEKELRLARQGARSAARSGRGIVPFDDLVGVANMWLATHTEKVAQWKEEGKHGENKLRRACMMAGLTVVARERRIQNGLMRGDAFYYSKAMIEDVLPMVFDPDDWTASQVPDTDTVRRGGGDPAEGGNTLATVMDVRRALDSLNDEDRTLLELLYADHLSYEVTGATLGLHERTVRRKAERAIERMVEALGGEYPWDRRRP